MPKFMKDNALFLLEGGIESYILGLHGMSIPSSFLRRRPETKYAPVMGLFGSAVELIVKACLVQAKGVSVIYKDGDTNSGVYKYGSDVIKDLRREVRSDSDSVAFLWKAPEHDAERQLLISYLDKCRLMQELRANGLHAGIGCSRDIAVAAANDISDFISLLAQGKRLRAYLKNIPSPETTIIDREAIIEDLTRRMNSTKDNRAKTDALLNMYLVLPYIPEIVPDWIDKFDNASVIPPSNDDINYLVKTLTDAHSIYLLKARGSKNGVPVRVENNNPNAVPIAVQNLKRELHSIPELFNTDVLTSNSRIKQGILDAPIEDFIIDLYSLGIEHSGILEQPGVCLTAQQTWPFVVSAYSTQGTPRPCWFLIKYCDELDQLVAFLARAKNIGNGYLKRRIDSVIDGIHAFANDSSVCFRGAKDQVFHGISQFKYDSQALQEQQLNPFVPLFIKQNPIRDDTKTIIQDFVTHRIDAGEALKEILSMSDTGKNEIKYAKKLIPLCLNSEDRHGLIAALRVDSMKTSASIARKQMFFIDFLTDGPKVV